MELIWSMIILLPNQHLNLTFSKTMDGIQFVPTFPGRFAHSPESLNPHMARSGNGKYEESAKANFEFVQVDAVDNA